MFNKFNSVSKFVVSGKRVLEYINAIRDSSIVCSWLGCKKDLYYGRVYTKDIPYLKQLAQDMEVEFLEKSRRGLFHFLGKYKKRYGIYIGVVIALTIWTILSNVVVTITIEGNENVSDSAILSCLQDMGLKKGAYIKDIDFKSCEYALRLNLDDIAWASIRHSRGRLVVSVNETVNKPTMLQQNIPCNLVSTKSARIVSVKVLNGQLMEVIGNGVKSGDLLISGIVKNEKEVVRYVHAMGEVIGEYQESITLTQPLNDSYVTTSNSTNTYKELELFNLSIPLYIGSKDIQSSYTTTSTEYAKLFGNTIPIGIKTIQANQYITVNKIYSKEEAKAILQDRKCTYEKNLLSNVTIVDCKQQYTINKDSVTLKLQYLVQGDICQQRDIFLR